MPKLPTTDWVDPNEGAILYSEINLPGPLFDEPHRYQIIKVIRNDAPAIYKKDLGPARNFVGGQVNVPGGMWNERTGKGKLWDGETIANLEGMGEQLRNRTKAESEALMIAHGHEYVDGTPEEWEEGYLKEADRRKMAASKKSVNGPHFSTTR